jgi:hypothetical protein
MSKWRPFRGQAFHWHVGRQRQRRAPSSTVVWTVRRDWPDGSHEFVGLKATPAAAGWFALGDRSFWRRSHYRPRLSVVEISVRDFDLHRHRQPCRAPDCPNATVMADAVNGAGVPW